MKLPFLAKLAIVILITVAISEIAPEAVNYILLLVLVGAVLGNWKEFAGLATLFGSLGK